MIKASVLIPMFRAKYIAWLTMEGWCRQQDVNVEWELIIAEETRCESFGEENVMEYRKRLEEVGCVSLKYIPLIDWIPLGAKWKLLLEQISDSSTLVFRDAADIFSAPQRMTTLYSLYEEHPEGHWFVPVSFIVYSIEKDESIIGDPEALLAMNPPRGDIGSVAVSANVIRKARLNMVSAKKNVDGVFRRAVMEAEPDLVIIRDLSDMWKYGISAHGFGNISRRSHIFNNIHKSKKYYPLVPCPFDIRETIPSDILDRLKKSIKYIPLHIKEFLPE